MRCSGQKTAERASDNLPPSMNPGRTRHVATFSQGATRDLLWLLPLGAALLGLYQYGRVLTEPVLILVGATSALLIGFGSFLRVRLRRRAWLDAYVASASPLQRWLRGGVLLLALRLLVAMFLAAMLIVGTLRLHAPNEHLILLAALPLLALIHHGAAALLARHVSAVYLPEAAWRVAMPLTFVLLAGGLTVTALWRPGPDFRLVSLENAVWYLAVREQAASPVLEQLLQGAAALEGLRWWLAQQVLPRLELPLLEGLGWVLVLLQNALLVWAWLHCCAGIMLFRALLGGNPPEGSHDTRH